jgi:hypothetical protein
MVREMWCTGFDDGGRGCEQRNAGGLKKLQKARKYPSQKASEKNKP